MNKNEQYNIEPDKWTSPYGSVAQVFLSQSTSNTAINITTDTSPNTATTTYITTTTNTGPCFSQDWNVFVNCFKYSYQQ